MNLILFESDEISEPLQRDDARTRHIVETLKMKSGDHFDAGIVNGPRGKARILEITASGIAFSFTPVSAAAPPDPIDVIVGLPRPQSARRILFDASALGVRQIAFVNTARSDPNYARSTLWTSGEWRRHLIDGAQQAFDTRIPQVRNGIVMGEAVAALPPGARIAFDNYEAPLGLPEFLRSAASEKPQSEWVATLAFGPERGWDTEDRRLLRSAGFTLASLGHRVMRVETAIASAVAVLRAELGWE